jgi:CHASE2 domain-containing sensor protein
VALKVNTGAQMHSRLAALLGLLSLSAGLLAFSYRFPEAWWQDRRFATNASWSDSTELVLVGVDERHAEAMAGAPPTGEYLARIVSAIAATGPSVIALDFSITRSRTDSIGDALDLAIREAVRRGIAVVLPTRIAQWRGEAAVVRQLPEEIADSVLTGFVGWEMADDRTAGLPAPRDYPVGRGVSSPCYALAFAVAVVAAHQGHLRTKPGACLEPGTVPDTAYRRIRERLGLPAQGDFFPLYFAGSMRSDLAAPYHSSERVLEEAMGALPPSEFEGRIVLVASVHRTPHREDAVVTPFGEERGGVVHAYAIDTLLHPHRRWSVDGPLVLIAITGAMFLTVVLLWARFPGVALLLSIAANVLFVLAAFVLFATAGYMVPVSAPLVMGMLGTAVGFILFGRADDLPSHGAHPSAGLAAEPSAPVVTKGGTPAQSPRLPPAAPTRVLALTASVVLLLIAAHALRGQPVGPGSVRPPG